MEAVELIRNSCTGHFQDFCVADIKSASDRIGRSLLGSAKIKLALIISLRKLSRMKRILGYEKIFPSQYC
ncbi:hypothetical protein Scep_007289 [Stephania cephalantha]|uniref:Uncharacterized protein n=1 Tax=Stephania cephalantha TaxID=152367 RepID=A0AAP0KC75_9MAGN